MRVAIQNFQAQRALRRFAACDTKPHALIHKSKLSIARPEVGLVGQFSQKPL